MFLRNTGLETVYKHFLRGPDAKAGLENHCPWCNKVSKFEYKWSSRCSPHEKKGIWKLKGTTHRRILIQFASRIGVCPLSFM